MQKDRGIVSQKVGGGKKLQFSDRILKDSCNVPRANFGAQNFNFALNFPEIGLFSPKLCIFRQKFYNKNIFQHPKI